MFYGPVKTVVKKILIMLTNLKPSFGMGWISWVTFRSKEISCSNSTQTKHIVVIIYTKSNK